MSRTAYRPGPPRPCRGCRAAVSTPAPSTKPEHPIARPTHCPLPAAQTPPPRTRPASLPGRRRGSAGQRHPAPAPRHGWRTVRSSTKGRRKRPAREQPPALTQSGASSAETSAGTGQARPRRASPNPDAETPPRAAGQTGTRVRSHGRLDGWFVAADYASCRCRSQSLLVV